MWIDNAFRQYLMSALAVDQPHMTLEPALDLRVLAFAIVSLAMTAGISGVLPALMAARTSPAEALGSQQRATLVEDFCKTAIAGAAPLRRYSVTATAFQPMRRPAGQLVHQSAGR